MLTPTKSLKLSSAILLLSAIVPLTPAKSQDSIKIAVTLPITGTYTVYSEPALRAINAWADQINATGGLLHRHVEFLVYDNAASPATAATIYRRLIESQKPDFTIAGFGAAVVAPGISAFKRSGGVLMGLAAGKVTTEPSPRYFNVSPTAPPSVESLTDGFFDVAVQQKPAPSSVAILAARAELSEKTAEGARQNVKKYGLKVVFDAQYSPTTSDFTAMVRQAQQSYPDLVVICSYPLDSEAIVKAVSEAEFKPMMIGGAMLGLQAATIKERLGSLLNGFTNFETAIPSRRQMFGTYSKLIDKLGSAFETQYAGWAFASLEVIEQAVRATETLNPENVSAYIHSHLFHTVVGDVRFAGDGDLLQDRIFLVQYRGVSPGAPVQETQTVLSPAAYKTGNLIYPFGAAR